MSNISVPTIREFYANKTLLITGATGFVGKVLLEKLLYSCPDIKRVYVLVREKKGSTPKDRVNGLINSPVFKVGRIHGGVLEQKIVAIHGDITAPGLGLSTVDKAVLTSEVEIVFHCAASIRFDEPLKDAVRTNLEGTKSVVQLCHELSQLVALVYVSTCYSNCHLKEIKEKRYPTKMKPTAILEAAQTMDSDKLERIVQCCDMYEGRPNSYTFTKALAENYVYDNRGNLSVSIARLSIVLGSLNEPEPGFCDTPNAAVLVLFLQGLGGLRTYKWDPNIRPNAIYVDTCVNSLIAIAWETATWNAGLKFYNVASSYDECFPHPLYMGCSTLVAHQYPSLTAFRAPADFSKPAGLLDYYYHKYISELLFCMLYDLAMWSCRKKSDMTSKMRFLHKTREALEPFHHEQWTFDRTNVDELMNKLDPSEQKIFSMKSGRVDFLKSTIATWTSLKKYKLKEDLRKLDFAKKRIERLKYVEYAFHSVVFVLTAFLVYGLISNVILT